jgi:uncharacterized protein
MTTTPYATSSTTAERIHVVDALRGFALLGILLVHISGYFYAGYPAKALQELSSQGMANHIAEGFSQIFVDGKFYTIFSLLFGLSFAIQFTSAQEKGRSFMGRFAWRLVILGLIGFAHQLNWRGDILMIYAFLGFILLLFQYAGNRLLLVSGILLMINIPGLVKNAYAAFKPGQAAAQSIGPPKEMVAQAEAYYQLVKHGSYLDIAKTNIGELQAKVDFQLWSGRVFITLGCFLLGMYAGRKRLFYNLSENRSFFKKLFKYSGFTILSLVVAAALTFLSLQGKSNPPAPVLVWMYFLYYISTAAFTFFYIAGVTLLLQRPNWQGVLTTLAPIGRMGLTNYILQSLIGVLIFYGYGLGLLGEVQPYVAFLLTFPIFFLQVIFSKWWLSQFKYGPLEWLWRSLTYFELQPLKIKQVLAS